MATGDPRFGVGGNNPPDRFSDCLQFTWQPRYDGQGYHVTKNDHGGATSWGVTEAAWIEWCRANPHTQPPLPALIAATPALFKPMIRARYWAPVSADLLPIGIDLMVYDFGYGSGPHTSAIVLQRLLQMDLVDGWIGPKTAAAAARWNRADLINALSAAHLSYLQAIGDPGGWLDFGHGWSNRNADRVAVARQMAGLDPAPAVSPYARNASTTDQLARKTR